MVEISGVFVGLIFVAAVTGLILINDIDNVESYQNDPNSEIKEDKIVLALNEFDAELVIFFSDLKEYLGI